MPSICSCESRNAQLPFGTPGTFIFVSLPKPHRSCTGTITVFAGLCQSVRIIARHEALSLPPTAQSPPGKPQYSSACARSCGSASHSQPSTVLLSCVPVYATQFFG